MKSGENGLKSYEGSTKKVVVYNTYADDYKIHFDVFIPTEEKSAAKIANEINDRAVEYAKEFLQLIGKPSENVQVNMCERCHIDNTDLYSNQLWQLPGKEVYVWPLEGCPKPTQ